MPADKIVLGGFSQGGTVSVLAGLTYPKTLGGICAISGWGAYRESLPAKVTAAGKQTPMLYTVGTGDPIVTFPLTKKTGELLESMLGDKVTVHHEDRMMHPPSQGEVMMAAQFIKKQLQL